MGVILCLLSLLHAGLLSWLNLGRSCGCHQLQSFCRLFHIDVSVLRRPELFIFCVIGPWSSLVISQYVFVNWIYWCNNQNCSRLGKCLTKQTAEEILMFGRIWAMCRSKSWKRFNIIQTWFVAHGSWEATAIRGTYGGVEDVAPTKIWRDFI